jgi:multifunctional methyltransferase subunit TRM112
MQPHHVHTYTRPKMKILTTNYLTCAVKACKSSPASFPLHFKDAELVQEELDLNPEFIRNILPRIEWGALVQTATEVAFPSPPPVHKDPKHHGKDEMVRVMDAES